MGLASAAGAPARPTKVKTVTGGEEANKFLANGWDLFQVFPMPPAGPRSTTVVAQPAIKYVMVWRGSGEPS